MRWTKVSDYEEEERIRKNEKLENMEKCLYLIQEAIKGWDLEEPKNWANILSEIENFLKELEEL